MTTAYVESETVPVRVTPKWDGGEYRTEDADFIVKAGQVIHMPMDSAARHARAGEVEYMTFIRALVDGVSAGSAGDLVLAKNDVAACPPDRAARLVADGVAAIATGPATLPRAKINHMAALTGAPAAP